MTTSRQRTDSMGRLNRRVVAWMALVLAVVLAMLQESPAPGFVHEHDAAATLSANSETAPDETPAPDEGKDETRTQGGESSEDDVVLDDGACVLVVVELKRPRAMSLEPDSRHTQRLERPPIRAA